MTTTAAAAAAAASATAPAEVTSAQLTFKVMRLTRPSFVSASPPPVSFIRGDEFEKMDEYLEEELSGISGRVGGGEEDCAGLSPFLQLPGGFGAIYLGEVFSGYVSVINTAPNDLQKVAIKAELQTGSKRSTLLDTTSTPTLTMAMGTNIDFLVEHEMKEACVHIMICTATFFDRNEEKKVRQYFKFQVLKPVSVNTKIHMMLESVYLENQIQNISQSPLFLDVVSFDASNAYKMTDMNDLNAGPGGKKVSGPLSIVGPTFGDLTYLRPGDVRQFTYRLKPVSGKLDPHDKAAGVLGRLEMRWRSAMGDPGRLHTYVNMVQWKLPPKREIEIAVSTLPEVIHLEQPFSVEWEVKNSTEKAVTLQLQLPTDVDRGVVACGAVSQLLPPLAPGESTKISAFLIAFSPGVQSIVGVSVVDSATDKAHHLPAPVQIFVERN